MTDDIVNPFVEDPAWTNSNLVAVGDDHSVWDYVSAIAGTGKDAPGSLGYDWANNPQMLVLQLAGEVMRRASVQASFVREVSAVHAEFKLVQADLADIRSLLHEANEEIVGGYEFDGEYVPLKLVSDDPTTRVDAIAGLGVAVSVVDDPDYVPGSEFGDQSDCSVDNVTVLEPVTLTVVRDPDDAA